MTTIMQQDTLSELNHKLLWTKTMKIHMDLASPASRAGHLAQGFAVEFAFPVIFTRQAFGSENTSMDAVFKPEADGMVRKVLVFIDESVANAWPSLLGQIPARLARFSHLELVGDIVLVPGGEAAKQGLAALEDVGRQAAAHGVDRQSYVIAIGGGAVLDAVGLGAALVHRGVRFVRMPSTVLAQNDAGIGVKNGVNAFGQKNFFGTFAPPHAVVNDLDLLDTLPDRHWRSGIAEAVKVACIKSGDFFAFLEERASDLAHRDEKAMEFLVRECARLHMEHTKTSGDPFETGSARPLDFGHWSAHWLEMASDGAVSHGEGVAIGLAIDVLYAESQGFISMDAAQCVINCLETTGFHLWHALLAQKDAQERPAVLAGLDHFREHLGGELTLTLPGPLGCSREVHAVDFDRLGACIEYLRARR